MREGEMGAPGRREGGQRRGTSAGPGVLHEVGEESMRSAKIA
jgi:hypothetical protein